MRLATFVAALLAASLAHAGHFTGAAVAPGDKLGISTADRSFPAPRTEPEQVGFQNPRISSDGRLVGWLALQPNCCTSYPLPGALVILDKNNALHRFAEAPPIWDWSFQRNNTAVAYRQRVTHGAAPVIYKLRRIRDGKLLGRFECFSEEEAAAPGRRSKPLPAWVRSIAEECPVTPASAAVDRKFR